MKFLKLTIRELHKRNYSLFWCGVLSLFLFVLSVFILLTDQTRISGVSVWHKPVIYFLSTAISAWSIGWVIFYLKPSGLVRWSGWGIFYCLNIKNGIIFFQSFRGTASHFNHTNPLDNLLYNGIILSDSIFLFLMLLTTYLFFQQKKMRISQHYTWGVRMAFLNFVIMSIAGISMHILSSNFVGAEYQIFRRIPFSNWNLSPVDLRIPHFLDIHALQVIPLISFYLFEKKNQVIAFSILYLFVGLFLYVISIAGINIF